MLMAVYALQIKAVLICTGVNWSKSEFAHGL